MMNQPIEPGKIYNIHQIATFMGMDEDTFKDKFITCQGGPKFRHRRVKWKRGYKYFFLGEWFGEDFDTLEDE